MNKKRSDKRNDLGFNERNEAESATNDVADARNGRERKFRQVMEKINKKYAGVFRRLNE